MPKNRKKYSSKKAKYRQQKLSVATVTTIATKVAKKLDRRQDARETYYYKTIEARDGYTWNEILAYPPTASWRPILGGALEAKEVSGIGSLVQNTFPAELTQVQQQSVDIYCTGIQTRLAFQNRTAMGCTVRLYLVFIPNLNIATGDSVDYLRPSVYMLYKQGSGNLLYDGWSKRELKNLSSVTAHGAQKYSILDKKTIYLKPALASGIVAPDIPIAAFNTKRVYLHKIFKGLGRKHTIKGSQAVGASLTNGTYYYMIHHDLPLGETLHYVSVTDFKFTAGTPTINIGGL